MAECVAVPAGWSVWLCASIPDIYILAAASTCPSQSAGNIAYSRSRARESQLYAAIAGLFSRYDKWRSLSFGRQVEICISLVIARVLASNCAGVLVCIRQRCAHSCLCHCSWTILHGSIFTYNVLAIRAVCDSFLTIATCQIIIEIEPPICRAFCLLHFNISFNLFFSFLWVLIACKTQNFHYYIAGHANIEKVSWYSVYFTQVSDFLHSKP